MSNARMEVNFFQHPLRWQSVVDATALPLGPQREAALRRLEEQRGLTNTWVAEGYPPKVIPMSQHALPWRRVTPDTLKSSTVDACVVTSGPKPYGLLDIKQEGSQRETSRIGIESTYPQYVLVPGDMLNPPQDPTELFMIGIATLKLADHTEEAL